MFVHDKKFLPLVQNVNFCLWRTQCFLAHKFKLGILMIESDDGSGNDEEWPRRVQHTVWCSPITSSRGATNDHTSSHKWCDDIFCTQLHSVGYNAMELTLLRTSANRRHHIWGVSGELGWCTGWCWWYTAEWYTDAGWYTAGGTLLGDTLLGGRLQYTR